MRTPPSTLRQFVLVITLSAVLFTGGCKSIVGGGAALREDVAGLHQGMTKEQVEEKLGGPWSINVTSSRYGKRTQWVYREAYTRAGQLYVYFENGTLTGTQY